MSLFPSANDFKSGPGVEKDAPRKTGVGRFFELVGRDMSGMFLANLLTCLGFLPVICLVYIGFLMNSLPVMVLSAAVGGILAGPVLAGMYDTVLRALRDEAGYWWTTYRKAFKQNFKASILPGVLYCVVVTVQIFLVYFCFNLLYHGTNACGWPRCSTSSSSTCCSLTCGPRWSCWTSLLARRSRTASTA
jgi:hypothetical protein